MSFTGWTDEDMDWSSAAALKGRLWYPMLEMLRQALYERIQRLDNVWFPGHVLHDPIDESVSFPNWCRSGWKQSFESNMDTLIENRFGVGGEIYEFVDSDSAYDSHNNAVQPALPYTWESMLVAIGASERITRQIVTAEWAYQQYLVLNKLTQIRTKSTNGAPVEINRQTARASWQECEDNWGTDSAYDLFDIGIIAGGIKYQDLFFDARRASARWEYTPTSMCNIAAYVQFYAVPGTSRPGHYDGEHPMAYVNPDHPIDENHYLLVQTSLAPAVGVPCQIDLAKIDAFPDALEPVDLETVYGYCVPFKFSPGFSYLYPVVLLEDHAVPGGFVYQ